MKTIKKIKNHPTVKKAVNTVLAVIASVATLLITALYRAVFFIKKTVKACAESTT
ncbi:MAG: hypothetical protein J6Q82_01550 [Clostridia bacterium]|nr:hypothetical protein [Clostridia bacterium]